MAPQSLGGFADVALGRQKDQHVAHGLFQGEFIDRGLEAIHRIGFAFVFRVFGDQRAVAGFDGIGSARNFDHRSRPVLAREVLAEAGGVDRGGGDDQPQIPPLGQEAFDVAQQKINVERPLVGLINDDRIVLIEEAVVLRFRQQNAVGHQLDVGARLGGIGEANFKTHLPAERRF